MAVAKNGAAKVDTSVPQAGRIIEKIKRRRLATSATGIGTITIAVGDIGDAVTKIVELLTNSSMQSLRRSLRRLSICRILFAQRPRN
jgi:hypothetical protein